MLNLFYKNPNFELTETTLEELLKLYEKGKVLPSGRRTSKLIEYKGKNYILKKEARGGILSSVLSDTYFSLSPFYREFEISAALFSRGLSIPILLLFGKKLNILYEVYSLTQFIDECISLKDLVLKDNCDEERIFKAGEAIAKMHNLGLYHFDLNLGNIIFSKDKTFIIDFRNSYFYDSPLNKTLSRKNIIRIFQSYLKETIKEGIECQKNFSKLLLDGYRTVRDEEWIKKLEKGNLFIKYKKLVYKARFSAIKRN